MTAIRRFLFLAFLLALAAPAAHAQYTAVTAQVKDPTGQLYTSCQVSANFVPSPTATTQPFINGSLFQTVVPVFACDSSGNFSVTLADNNQVSDGRGGGPVSQWSFNICSAPGKYPGPQYCFNYTGIITGASLNLTTTLQAVAAALPSTGGGGGSTPCTTTPLSIQYNNAGALGCIDTSTYTAASHNLALTASADNTTPFSLFSHSSTQSVPVGIFQNGGTTTPKYPFDFSGASAITSPNTVNPALVRFDNSDPNGTLPIFNQIFTSKYLAANFSPEPFAFNILDYSVSGPSIYPQFDVGMTVDAGASNYNLLIVPENNGDCPNGQAQVELVVGNQAGGSGGQLRYCFQNSSVGPNVDAHADLGTASFRWNNFFMSGAATIGGHIIATGLQSTGTPASALCTDSSHNVIEFSAADCFGGGGGGVVLQTNGVNNSSQTTFNLINGASFNGLTPTFTNTSGGIVQAGFTGTLGNAGLTNSATTVNGQTCTLGSTCNVPFSVVGTPNTSLIGLNAVPSTVNTIGLSLTPSNPATNQWKWEAGGTLLPVGGGTGKDFSACTGVIQVAAGTFSCSTALANGTTATTQATNDNTTKVATGAAVQATTSLANLATVGTITTGAWQGTAVGSQWGGTGINSSVSTGVPHVTAGTWAVSTALPNPTTATTQSCGDTSLDVATDQFFANCAVSNPMTTLGDEVYGGSAGAFTRLAGCTLVASVPCTLIETPTAGPTAAAPAWANAGIPTNAQTGTTYTVAATDRASHVTFSNAGAIAVTLPQANTTGFASNFAFQACDIGTGTATITPTTSTISYTNGASYTSAASSMAIATGQCATVYSDNTNYFANITVSGTTGSAGGDLSGTYPNPTVAKVNGAVVPTSAAVLGSNGSNQLIAATGHQVTVPLACADSSGSGTAQVCNTSPTFTPAAGDSIMYSTTTSNTGALAINVNSLGAKAVTKYQGSALASGDIKLNVPMLLTYDGTEWQIPGIGNAPAGSGTVNSCSTTAAIAVYGTATSTAVGCGLADFTIPTAGHTLTAGSLGLVDLSAEASGGLKIPVAAGATSAADGSIDYDSTNKNTHIRANAADAIAAAESSAIVVNTVPKSSSSTVGLLVGSSIVDNGTNITSTEPVILGTDGSTAGSVQLANSGAAFHSIITSAATANNTFALPATAPTTGDLLSVTTSGTTATVTDSTVLAANVVTATANATAAKNICVAAGASKTCSYVDFPDVKDIPAANCNATAGAGWSIPATNAPTVACRAGTNNLGGVLQWANNNTTTNSQFEIEIPGDWDSATQPYWNIFYGSGANTSGTVKWTISSACTKADGSVTDDPAFVAETTSTGKTMAVANRAWAESAQFANVTSGNNCVAGGSMQVKITSGNGTATSTVNVSKMVLTFPRLITVQAN